MLKYPLVLVHGVGFHDKFFFVNYWGRIASGIESMGVAISYGNNDAWGTIADSAIFIKEVIDSVLLRTKAEKVNIIAHSRGGLDCRYLISSLGYSYKVASLTTISTPHRGSKCLDPLLAMPDWIVRIVSVFANTYFRILGDRSPQFGIATRELSEISCKDFNEKNPNMDGVYYQSFGSKLRSPFNDLLFFFMNLIIQLFDGSNDGVVAFRSIQWTNFREIKPANSKKGLSHADVVDLRRMDRFGFDICAFYKNMIYELAEKGF